jgi:hypothetical protein
MRTHQIRKYKKFLKQEHQQSFGQFLLVQLFLFLFFFSLPPFLGDADTEPEAYDNVGDEGLDDLGPFISD